jgi:AcrR family transcriptional regulator
MPARRRGADRSPPPPERVAASTTAAPATAVVDGRRARAGRTRGAIVEALLALVGEGQAAPTAAAIARRAKVSVRSIAGHFPTRAALVAAAASHYRERPAPPEPAADEPRERRLTALLATRAAELEASRPIRAAAARLAGEYPVAAEALATSAARRRETVARVFAPELARGGGDLLEILDLLLGGRVWDALRERGLAIGDAQRLIGDQARRALAALA